MHALTVRVLRPDTASINADYRYIRCGASVTVVATRKSRHATELPCLAFVSEEAAIQSTAERPSSLSAAMSSTHSVNPWHAQRAEHLLHATATQGGRTQAADVPIHVDHPNR
jgi:hypothetical protein